MTPQKYEQLRSQIIEAVPEIMELKFGCKIQISNGTPFIIMRKTSWDDKSFLLNDGTAMSLEQIEYTKFLKILGRPITLCDVLRAISKKNTYPLYTVGIDATGSFLFDRVPSGEDGRRWIYTDNNGQHYAWNLSKDSLDDQSDNTKDFLFTLLCTENL